MILKRFFKPKWQHPNPQIRKRAVCLLEASDPVLVQAAREDQDSDVRCAALGRITDIAVLQQIFAWDPAADVREAAKERFRHVLTGKDSEAPVLETRIAALAQKTPGSELAEFLAVHALEPELRVAALAHVERDTFLLERITEDLAANVRLAALERIQQPSTLEQVVKSVGKRDKRVYRRAQERLESFRAQREQVARREQICAEMEVLADKGEAGQNASRFHKLEKAWGGLETGVQSELRERYQRAHGRFLLWLQKQAERRAKKITICKALEDLQERLGVEDELLQELARVIEDGLTKTRNDWENVGPLDAAEERRLAERFSKLRDAIQRQERRLRRNAERAQQLRGLLQEGETLRHQAGAVSERDIKALKARWEGLERPEADTLAKELQDRFDAVLNGLRSRLHRQMERREQEQEEIEQLVTRLEKALEEGELQQAISLRDRVRHHLKSAVSLTQARRAVVEERLQASATKIGALRDWRRWGTDQARENLCTELEALIGVQEEPETIARQVREARVRWQRLDRAEGPAPEALWERFNKACNRAYEPCQAYFDEQSRERQKNLQKKRAVWERLAQFAETIDWEHVNWREVDRAMREARDEWRGIGPVARADRKDLEQYYHEVSEPLETHLREERARDLRRRKGLIERVQGLVQREDLRSAIEDAKRAQAEWKPTVQVSRREEQALWKEFRAACDAIFERRDAERRAADEERQSNLARKTACCEDIEALSVKAGEALLQSTDRIHEIQNQWEAIGPVPRAVQKDIEIRFRKACKAFERRFDEQRKAELQAQAQGLRQRAQLCVWVESLSPNEESETAAATVEEAKREWDALPPLQDALDTLVQRRFEAACRAVIEGGETYQALLQSYKANLERKQELCLLLEILAGVDSPEEFSQARMEYQVSRLSDALGGGDETPAGKGVLDEVWKIEQEWYELGPAPGDQNEALDSRFDRAMAALSA